MTQEVENVFGEYIKASRLKAGYTQKQLGLLCGYDESAAERVVQYWEADKREVPLARVRALAKALKIPLESLIP